jgi:signal transduction histidine kinase
MLVLVLVPLIAIIPLVGVRVVSEVGNLQTEGHIHGQTLIAQRISGLVSALDDERDLTEVALAGSGVAKDTQLAAAERTTTAEIRKFDDSLRQYRGSVNALPYATQQLGARAEARLGDIGPLRAAIQRLGVGTPTFSAYTTIVENLLDFCDQLAAVNSDHPLGSLVSTLAAIEQIEQQTSSERGYLVDVLDRGDFTLEQKEDIEQAQAQFATASNSLANNAPTSILNLYQSTVSGDKVGAADGTVQAVSAAAQEDIPLGSLGVSKATAFDQMTDKLKAVQIVKQQVVGDMSQRASHLLSAGRTQLYENIGIIVAVMLLSFLGALVLARSIVRPLRRLRSSALEIADHHLPEVVRRLHDAEPSDESVRIQPIELQTQDEVGQVARAFDRVHFEAVRLATEQARMRSNVNAIFTNLSRRSESLVLRQLQLIDDLENGEQNPTQLASLFQLDHLATRMRRNNENLLVLAGEEQGRRWNQPVSLIDLVRAATAEVEQYERVVLYELPDVAVAGHAATDVVHLVAELIENATAYSGPETQVLIGARTLAAGDVVLDIADAGIGIRPEELGRINRRLAEPPVLDVAISRRMGLFVVGRLAAKYRIQVRLTSSAAVGLNALVRSPPVLLVPASELDGTGGAAFDQSALRPGPHESYDLSGVLNTGVPSRPVGEPRFDSSYGSAVGASGSDRRFDDMAAGYYAGPPGDDFPWFRDEAEPGVYAGDGFSWFDQSPAEHPLPTGTDRALPLPEGSPASGRHTYPGLEPGERGSDRLPIFESTRSQWSEPDGRARPDSGGRAAGAQPLPGRSGETGQQPRGVDRSSPAWARSDDNWRAAAAESTGGSTQQGLTQQGLPQRVPSGHRVPGPLPQNGASQPNAAPTAPRAAKLMRERLSSFHQGVRQGKDGTEGDRRGPSPGGSDPI